jgi:hypothetical protein
MVGGQGDEGIALGRLEQLASAQAEVAHGKFAHALHDEGDPGVAFGEREERQMAKPSQNVGLTPASTFALPLGRLGRIGRTEQWAAIAP